MFFKVIFASFIIGLISCTHEHTQTVPLEFQSYVDDFFIDARKKGINIDLTDFTLDMSFTSIADADGRCYFQGNQVVIDSNYWIKAHPLERRWLIYHELGHCILDRRHDDERFPNGECKSLMRGNFDCSENNISELWWEYYLGELFIRNNDLPNWYNLSAKPANIYTANYEKWDTTLIVNDNEWTPDLSWTFGIDYSKDFQIVVNYPNPPKEILPKMKTKEFLFSSNKFNTSIDFYLAHGQTFDQIEIFKSSADYGEDAEFTIKYVNKFLYFFINGNLVHVFEFEFDAPIEIYNLTFRANTFLKIEAGNI